MKPYTLILSVALLILSCATQAPKTDIVKKSNAKTSLTSSRPKLVIGIVVDQMRYDYLTRFESKYSEGGFKRLLKNGYNCKNNHFNYVPTYTGPGHASVHTGTTPKYHGIISNYWYNKAEKEMVYCAADENTQPIGTTSKAGKMSPHRMLTTTFADENKLFTQLKGKTIGIAIKDRGAILPAGHTADAAYWFHGENEGKWITSSFYTSTLPQWVESFNNSGTAASYLKPWDTYYPIATYTESGADDNTYEGGFKGKTTATFPYDLKGLDASNGGFDILKKTAYGNNLTTDFAMAAIKGEQLGKDSITDVLTLSYSSTDYVGHNFGVNSKEIQDTYIRLDKDIERLLLFLDAEVGKNEYTIFLTADHGAVHVPSYLKDIKIPAGYLDNKARKAQFNSFLTATFGTTDIVENVSNNQVFLNKDVVKQLKLDIHHVEQAIVDEQISYQNIAKVYTATTMNTANFTTGIEALLQNGFNQKRSGDVIIVNDIAHIAYSKTGSTHGSGLNYDTHVPLVFYGKGINQGSTFNKTVIPDIASTMSALLGISFPNGSTGRVLEEVINH